MFDNILVAMDGSQPSKNALEVAINIAKRYGAQLSIVHASYRDVTIEALKEAASRFGFLHSVAGELSDPNIITPVTAPATGVVVVVVPDATLEKFGKLLLEKAALSANEAGLDTVVTGLLHENAVSEILRYVDRNAIDLIVCGSRGLGGLKGLFFGGEGLVCEFTGKGRLWFQTRNAPALGSFLHPFRRVKPKKND